MKFNYFIYLITKYKLKKERKQKRGPRQQPIEEEERKGEKQAR